MMLTVTSRFHIWKTRYERDSLRCNDLFVSQALTNEVRLIKSKRKGAANNGNPLYLMSIPT